MTNDELLSLKKNAKVQGELLAAAGLHRSKTYILIHSDLPIVIDQLMRTNNELTKITALYDEMCKIQTWKARADVINALTKTKAFPRKWILHHFGGNNVKG